MTNFSVLSLALKPVPLPGRGSGDDLGKPMRLGWVSRCTGGFAEMGVLTPKQISLAFALRGLIGGWFRSVLPRLGFSKGLVWVLPAVFWKRFSMLLLCCLFLCWFGERRLPGGEVLQTKERRSPWQPWLSVLLLLGVRATFVLAQRDRNPRPYKEVVWWRGVWMVHAPLRAP